MIDQKDKTMSLRKQFHLLQLNRSGFYYKPTSSREEETSLANEIHNLWLEMPFY